MSYQIKTIINNLYKSANVKNHAELKSHIFSTLYFNKKDKQEDMEQTKQVGGNHYDMNITPVDYINANKLDFFEGNVIKYVSRHRKKNGAEDIHKAISYLEMILKYEYNEEI